MANEKLVEYQFSHPPSSFVIQFSSSADGHAVPGIYPGYDWHDYSSTVGEVMGVVSNINRQDPNLSGMDLFHEVQKRANSEPSFRGRASHVLLSLFNRGYFGDDESLTYTELDEAVWSSETGQPINPTFKEDQTDLPANLQI